MLRVRCSSGSRDFWISEEIASFIGVLEKYRELASPTPTYVIPLVSESDLRLIIKALDSLAGDSSGGSHEMLKNNLYICTEDLIRLLKVADFLQIHCLIPLFSKVVGQRMQSRLCFTYHPL